MTAYGFMPETPCARCKGRWPTRYQYVITAMGPDSNAVVPLCQVCFAAILNRGSARQFNEEFVGAVRRMQEGG